MNYWRVLKKAYSLYGRRSPFDKRYLSLGAQVSNGAHIDVNSTIDKNVALFDGATLINSSVGAFSYIQSDSIIVNASIGKFCSIAGDVKIGMAEHPLNWVSTSPIFYDMSQPLPMALTEEKNHFGQQIQTSIGSDVWIGQGVIVKSGVSISVGSVIGAGAVVTKDVAPYSIVVGNPARPIRQRFGQEMCDALSISKWWELDSEILRELSVFFKTPEVFLSELQRRNLG
jgi:acetyltransferase-like isoleucine patch superfamily enzyme